ncbi:MAG: hypothetical protein IPG87_15960 [Saprospiraceae bacterium]|nr:hypothetical protein [Candidatus Vicinibacter affinis]
MKYFAIILLSIIGFKLQAQELHVYYNVFKDSLWYVKDGKDIENPIVKKGKQITVHLVNYNNYIYSSNFEVKQFKQSPVLVGGLAGSNSTDFTEMLSVYGQNNAAQAQLLNTSLFGAIFKVLSTSQKEGSIRGAAFNMTEFNNKIESLNNQAESINEIIKIINKRKKLKTFIDVENQDIQNVKMNPNIDPLSMRAFLISYYNDVFQLDQNGMLSNLNLQQINEQLQEIDQLQNNLKINIQKYQESIKEMIKDVKLIKKIDQSNYNIIQSISNLEQKEAVLLAEASVLQYGLNNQGTRDYYQQLLNMYMNYLEIKNNTFTHDYQVIAESEYILFNINLVKNDSLNLNPSSLSGRNAKNKSAQFVARTYGDLYFGTSLGLAVGRFNKTPQRFFVSNDIITSQDLDSYYPMFNSLINIAYKFNAGVIPCLSIGAGIPISSQEQTSGLNYFVGAGLLFGRNAKIQLGGGFMFTKIDVLSNGFKVGDPINLGDGIIPLEKKYTQGYYIGLSFNLN